MLTAVMVNRIKQHMENYKLSTSAKYEYFPKNKKDILS